MLLECRNISKSYVGTETSNAAKVSTWPHAGKAQDAADIASASALLHASTDASPRTLSPSFQALRDVSLNVNHGETVGIIGPSGSGKSTLARIIAGLEQADSGSVTFCGVSVDQDKRVSLEHSKRSTRNVIENRKLSRKGKRVFLGHNKYVSRKQRALQRTTWLAMQMIFQNPEATFLPSMTLEQAVAEGLRYQNRAVSSGKHQHELNSEHHHPAPISSPTSAHPSRAEIHQAVLSAFDAVGLPSSFLSRHAFELSGGQCQRAAIARAIISAPKLIICDEPTSSLDVISQASIMELLSHLHKEHGMAFIFISHNEVLVREFCQRFYHLESGRITGEFILSDE